MAQKYMLQANESVICQFDRVCTNIKFGGFSDELLLTNLNIVHTRKGAFGNVKAIQTYPVNQIKIYEDEAQALLVRDSSGWYAVNIYLRDEQLRFMFESKKNARRLADEINMLLVGKVAKTETDSSWALPGTDVIAATVKDTVDTFKGVLGIGVGAATSRSVKDTTEVTVKCRGCHAMITGPKGRTVRCKYCDTKQQL